jgi:outer membrane protein assembly factor BamB
MRSLLKLVIASAVATTFISCSSGPWGSPRPSQPPRLNANTLAKAGLQYYWQLPLTMDPGESIRIIYKLDENLYAITDQDRLICVDKDRGLIKWIYAIRTDGEHIFRPSQADEAKLAPRPPSTTQIAENSLYERTKFRPVVINTTNHIYVLDRDSGKLIRDIKLRFAAVTGTSTDGTYAFVGSDEGNCCSILLDEAVPNWVLGTGSTIDVSPVIAAGRVFFGGNDGVVRSAFIGRESRKDWKRTLGGSIKGPLAVSDKACLIPCDDYRLYAFQPATGIPLWKQPFITKGQLQEPPQMGPTTVFQYSNGDKFYAINLVSGQKRWESTTARAVLALMDHNAYVLSKGNNLQITDEVLGTVKEQLPLSGFDLYVGNTTASAIFVGNHNGLIACIRLLSAGYIKPSDLPPSPEK